MVRANYKNAQKGIDYTPIYVLDNGEKAQDRFCLVEMNSTISSYSEGSTQSISRENYDSLVEGLKKLNEKLGTDPNFSERKNI